MSGGLIILKFRNCSALFKYSYFADIGNPWWALKFCMVDCFNSSVYQVGDLMDNYEAGVLQHGAKMVLLMEIIEKSVQLGDKMLVFRWGYCLKCEIFKFLLPSYFIFFIVFVLFQSKFIDAQHYWRFPEETCCSAIAISTNLSTYSLGEKQKLLP